MNRERLWILLGKKMNGELSSDEREELANLLRNSGEITFTSELLERLWNVPLTPVQTEDAESMNWEAIREGISEKEGLVRKIRTSKKWFLAAASFLLLVIGACGMYWFALHKAAHADGLANIIRTRPDSRSKVSLPDGTTVLLNSDSKISYDKDYGETNRDIVLEGEAFFDAAHNNQLPLTVHAKGINIQVMGTAFNVTAYRMDSAVTTSLIKGMVQVSQPSRPGWHVILKPNEKITLSPQMTDSIATNEAPGQRPGAIVRLKPEPKSGLIPELSWVDNKLVFYREPFSSVAVRLGRWYHVYFLLEDEKLKPITLTGIFDKESLKQALTALQLSCHFHYNIKADTVTVTH